MTRLSSCCYICATEIKRIVKQQFFKEFRATENFPRDFPGAIEVHKQDNMIGQIYGLNLPRFLAAFSSSCILKPANRESLPALFRGLWRERMSMRWIIFALFAQ